MHCDNCFKKKDTWTNIEFLRSPTCKLFQTTFGFSLEQAGNIFAWYRTQKKKKNFNEIMTMLKEICDGSETSTTVPSKNAKATQQSLPKKKIAEPKTKTTTTKTAINKNNKTKTTTTNTNTNKNNNNKKIPPTTKTKPTKKSV